MTTKKGAWMAYTKGRGISYSQGGGNFLICEKLDAETASDAYLEAARKGMKHVFYNPEYVTFIP